MFSYLLNILLGQCCIGCNKLGTLLCLDCAERLPHCSDRNLSGGVIACLSYKDERVHKLVGMMKFRSAWTVGKPLGRILYERMLEDMGDAFLFDGISPTSDVGEILVVPIPLSSARLRERGYNQSEMLARALCANDDEHFALSTKALAKVRDTKRQVETRSRDERLTNLHDAFRASKKIVEGRHIILVDDVSTTGATLMEGKKALEAGGAASVICLALAH